MTFRGRLVLAAAIAVVIAVLAACAVAYVASRDSLLGSVDGTLRATADLTLRTGPIHIDRNQPGQFVDASGTVLYSNNVVAIPVTSDVKAAAAGHNPGSTYKTVTLHGLPYRELVVGTLHVVVPGAGTFNTGTPVAAALQLVLPLSSVNHQLTHLRSGLVLIAIAGIAVAVLLAWLVGRTALVPLNDLTAAVEDVAATTDVSRRLDPGGPDELGRLRRAFNHLLAALDRSQQAQRQLVLDAGHELRTPLTSLRTNLEVVRRLDELPPEERAVLVDDLLTQMGELTNLVTDLSELARGDQRPQGPTTFRLDRLVEDAVGMATTHGRPRDVRFELGALPTWICGQRDRVSRAVGNLLDNALKWSPDGGVVEVYCGEGTVTVRDHGPGISPEDLPHIFDRFYRAAAARRLPGSGLGLAIVAQVAEAEGGSVTASQATDGPGAVFILSFPSVAPPPPRRAANWSGGAEGIGDDDDDDDDDMDGVEGFGMDDAGDDAGGDAGDDVLLGHGRVEPEVSAERAPVQGEQVPDQDASHNGATTRVTPAPGWGLPGS